MESTRPIARTTGVLLLIALVSSPVAGAIMPAIKGTDYLAGVASHPLRMTAASLGYLVAAVTSVGIAVSLYPLLKPRHTALAMGAVVFRTIETVLYTVGIVSLLTIGSLARDVAAGEASNRSATQSIADALVSIHDHSSAGAVFAFGIGAFMYYVAMWRARLLPRWLTGWGALAVVALEIAVVLAIVGDTVVTGYVALAAPIGVQELVMGVWMLVKGFTAYDEAVAEPATAGLA